MKRQFDRLKRCAVIVVSGRFFLGRLKVRLLEVVVDMEIAVGDGFLAEACLKILRKQTITICNSASPILWVKIQRGLPDRSNAMIKVRSHESPFVTLQKKTPCQTQRNLFKIIIIFLLLRQNILYIFQAIKLASFSFKEIKKNE